MANVKSGRRKVIGVVAVVIVLVILYFLNGMELIQDNNNNAQTQTIQQSVEGELILTMIDVGQADSFLLMQDGKTALIDCGTRSTGENVVEYLNNIGITKLDYVFGTHPHEDHMGGMYDVITNFEIGQIIIPQVEVGAVTSNWYMKLMDEITSNNYNVKYPDVEAVYELGDAYIQVIGPVTKFPQNLNNYSTVLKISFGEMDIIMTGDAEMEVEEEILAYGHYLDAEILKVGHHGSDTSTSEEFLDAISPDYALISAKVGNKYEHPTKSTMEKLEERNIEVYRTDENGTVIATITSDDIKFDCEPGDYLSGIELEQKENSK